jgi:ferrous iron transport protein B
VWGIFHLPSLILLGAYLLGIIMALVMGRIFRRTLLKSEPSFLVIELPPYKAPAVKQVFRHMWDRSKLFLQKAGTVILGINIIIWFISAYPKNIDIDQQYASLKSSLVQSSANESKDAASIAKQVDELDRQAAEAKLEQSFAGKIGRMIEPFIAPLGMDWKIGVSIVTSFAAREVFVSTLATVYNVANHDDLEHGLAETLQKQKRADGSRLYTPLMRATIIVFYVFALQCISTIVMVRRETNSWKWPLFQWLYLTGMAWIMSFVTYQGGRWLGL